LQIPVELHELLQPRAALVDTHFMLRCAPISKSAGALVLSMAAILSVVGNGTVASAQLPRARMSLPRSIPPSPEFLVSGICGSDVPTDSATCTSAVLQAIDNARTSEPLPAIPRAFNITNFDKLTGPEQVFAITDIERTARGVAPIAALTNQLDSIAAYGAAHQTDPTTRLPLRLTKGGLATAYGSNFAEGTANAIGSDYYWMYDDGLYSPNAACTSRNTKPCWGHRENILFSYSNTAYCPAGSKPTMYMGAAEVTGGVKWSPSITEIFVNDCGMMPNDRNFTWPDVQKLIFNN
jgi:hypothetical protein